MPLFEQLSKRLEDGNQDSIKNELQKTLEEEAIQERISEHLITRMMLGIKSNFEWAAEQ